MQTKRLRARLLQGIPVRGMQGHVRQPPVQQVDDSEHEQEVSSGDETAGTILSTFVMREVSELEETAMQQMQETL